MHASQFIAQLIRAFEDHVDDKSTMSKILECAEDQEFGTERSRELFSEVRDKTIAAERSENTQSIEQLFFEEACAKALFNFGRPAAAYDPDAQFWIVPLALRLCKHLDLPIEHVTNLAFKD
ncbi:hypothetical protein [Sphingorhabdus sp. Alg231-15]|uniref:hypothetical protein n=1 Tax=Sphingorhabdus sp. Alg231-15 TaxID=1922222 RepID=UPI000D556905